MKRIVFFIVMCYICLTSISKAYISDDMKGIWVATVYNLDYPSSPTTDVNTLKSEIKTILNNISEMGYNAVFFQVRPSADSFYKSDIFPWSKYLTGQNGLAPLDGFDPLTFLAEEAHKKGIEVHAWINPYRITKKGDEEYASISSESPAKKHPEYVVKYSDGNYYFNPGIPEVRKMVVDGAVEIVKNYQIDGIHMDDYFYPGTSFNDTETYNKYRNGFSNIGDWRRNNVDLLIQEINEAVHKANKNVSFGISPFAIWMNSSSSSLGSNTKGTESYNSHYADTRKWVENSWIDYIAPQIYWEVGHKSANYAELLSWWNNVASGSRTKLYIGLADYKSVGVSSKSVWYRGKEIEKQLKLNDTHINVAGEIHYRYSSMLSDKYVWNIVKKYYKNDEITVFVNGDKVKFDQKPFIENSRTLVPMRAIFEALDAEVIWNGEGRTITVTKGKSSIFLKVDSNKMLVNGKEKTIDVPAKIVGNRTLVPLRAISEALNSDVEWYPDSKTILINDTL